MITIAQTEPIGIHQPEDGPKDFVLTAFGLGCITQGATSGEVPVAAPALAFYSFESHTVGAVVLSEQLERYIAAADQVLRPSQRTDVPLGFEPDDYPVR